MDQVSDSRFEYVVDMLWRFISPSLHSFPLAPTFRKVNNLSFSVGPWPWVAS